MNAGTLFRIGIIVAGMAGCGSPAESELPAHSSRDESGEQPHVLAREEPAEPPTAAPPETREQTSAGRQVVDGYGQPAGSPTRGNGPVPHIVLGEAQARGGLAAPTVRRVVRRHTSELMRCFESLLVEQPTLVGAAVLVLRVGADGSVVSADLEGSSLPQLRPCVLESARTWTFPAPEGGAAVDARVPLRFSYL